MAKISLLKSLGIIILLWRYMMKIKHKSDENRPAFKVLSYILSKTYLQMDLYIVFIPFVRHTMKITST